MLRSNVYLLYGERPANARKAKQTDDTDTQLIAIISHRTINISKFAQFMDIQTVHTNYCLNITIFNWI